MSSHFMAREMLLETAANGNSQSTDEVLCVSGSEERSNHIKL